MMWAWMSLLSAVLLGLYDVAKKKALEKNGVLWVLFASTALTSLFLCHFLSEGCPQDHLKLILKAFLVTASWISGLAALRTLPLTLASPMKATRPIFVIVFSIVLFGERLNLWQWGGVVLALAALWLLSVSGKREGIKFTADRGVAYMAVSIVTGAVSALYDKYIVKGMDPLFIQSWTNVYITVLLGICIAVKYMSRRKDFKHLRPDWTLVAIAVLITAADALYFFALKQDGALLAVVSLIRRSSTIVTFTVGAMVFKERNIRGKAVDMCILLAGVCLLMLGSSI